jgi:hypothetical protein
VKTPLVSLSQKDDKTHVSGDKSQKPSGGEKRTHLTPSKSDAHMTKSKIKSSTPEQLPPKTSSTSKDTNDAVPLKAKTTPIQIGSSEKASIKTTKHPKPKFTCKKNEDAQIVTDSEPKDNTTTTSNPNNNNLVIKATAENKEDNESHSKNKKFKQFLSAFKAKFQLSFGRYESKTLSQNQTEVTNEDHLSLQPPRPKNSDTEKAQPSTSPQSLSSKKRPTRKHVSRYNPSELDATV